MKREEVFFFFFFFSSRRRHTRLTCDWSSDVCSSDLGKGQDSALRQQLLDQAAPPRSERSAQCVLFAARLGTELQEVGNVHAGDQQNKGDRAKKRVERLPGKAIKVF